MATVETDPLPDVCSDRGKGVRTSLADVDSTDPTEYARQRAESLIRGLFFPPKQAQDLGHDLSAVNGPIPVSVTFSEPFRQQTSLSDVDLDQASQKLNQQFATLDPDEGTPAMDVSLRFGPP